MAITQVGFLGRTGPVFVDDATVPGKFIVLQGQAENGAMKLFAVQPAYADALRTSTATPASSYIFPYSSSQCSLANYTDRQFVMNAPAYRQPANGTVFDYYVNVATDWVAATNISGVTNTTTTTTPTTTTPGNNTTTTPGNNTTPTDTTFAAPTITEQITTFLSNYWWLVLLILVALLWKPIIGPALGLSKKKRSYR